MAELGNRPPMIGPVTGEIVDGRQSARALEIARGTCRMLRALGLATITELPLANGRRADIVALSAKADLWILEVKSCLADFRSDAKWTNYADYCDRLYFAVAPDFPVEVIPAEVGLVIADRYGAEIVREPAEHRLAGGRRKAMLLDFARLTAFRIQLLVDPGQE